MTPHVTEGLRLRTPSAELTLAPREKGAVQIELETAEPAGPHLVTADIASEGIDLRRWVEAMVTVKP